MPSFRQVVLSEQNPTISSPITVAFSAPSGSDNIAGNLICVVAIAFTNQNDTQPTFSTPTDSNNSYLPCTGTSFSDPSNSSSGKAWYAAGIAGGANTVSIAFTAGNDPASTNIGLYAFELSGVNAYDNGIGAAGQTTASVVSTGPWTVNKSGIIIAAGIGNGNNTGAGTNYTLIETTTNYGGCLEYRTGTGFTGTETTTYPIDQAVGFFGIIAANFYRSGVGILQYTDTIFYGMT